MLQALAAPARWEELAAALEEMEGAADWEEAKRSGRVVASRGADEGYDAACDELAGVERELQVGGP